MKIFLCGAVCVTLLWAWVTKTFQKTEATVRSESSLMPVVYDLEGAKRRQDTEIRRAREALRRTHAPKERWEEMLRTATFPRELDQAFYFGLRGTQPNRAFQTLVDGAFEKNAPDRVQGRRLDLITVAIRGRADDPQDLWACQIAGQIGQLPPKVRDAFPMQLAVSRALLLKDILTRIRSHRLPAETAIRFTEVAYDRPPLPLYVLGLVEEAPHAVTFWRQSRLIEQWDRVGLDALRDENDLRLDEVEAFLIALVRTGIVDTARLQTECRRQLSQLRQFPRASRLDDGVLLLLIGLSGGTKDLEKDLAPLLHGSSRARIERLLKSRPARRRAEP